MSHIPSIEQIGLVVMIDENCKGAAAAAAAAAKSLQSCPTLLRPHRWQPTRLRRPWDSPGKNTGVGFHFLLQCMKVKVKSLSKCPTLRDPTGLQPTRLLRPWDSPGKSIGAGCHCPLLPVNSRSLSG